MNQVSLDDTDVPGGHIDIDFEPSQVTVLQLKTMAGSAWPEARRKQAGANSEG